MCRTTTRKLRALQTKATAKTSLLPTIETSDPELASALLRLALIETAENHRMVAAAYRKAGVTDYAYRHYQRALRLEPCDSLRVRGAGADLARLGMPESALGDAYRAIIAGLSRPARTTRSARCFSARADGERAMGVRARARAGPARGLRAEQPLLPLAARKETAGPRSRRANGRWPWIRRMTTARTNLALAYVMQGDIAGAEERLLEIPIRHRAVQRRHAANVDGSIRGAARGVRRGRDRAASVARGRQRAVQARAQIVAAEGAIDADCRKRGNGRRCTTPGRRRR